MQKRTFSLRLECNRFAAVPRSTASGGRPTVTAVIIGADSYRRDHWRSAAPAEGRGRWRRRAATMLQCFLKPFGVGVFKAFVYLLAAEGRSRWRRQRQKLRDARGLSTACSIDTQRKRPDSSPRPIPPQRNRQDSPPRPIPPAPPSIPPVPADDGAGLSTVSIFVATVGSIGTRCKRPRQRPAVARDGPHSASSQRSSPRRRRAPPPRRPGHRGDCAHVRGVGLRPTGPRWPARGPGGGSGWGGARARATGVLLLPRAEFESEDV